MDVMPHRADYTQPVTAERSDHCVLEISDIEVKRKISELCGLGGIIPYSHHPHHAAWTKEANIDRLSRRAEIIYQPFPGRIASDKPRGMAVFLNQCVYALDRLVRLLRWLQSHGLVSEHFVVLRVNPEFKVEGVRIPIERIRSLSECAERTANLIAQGNEQMLEDCVDKLSTAAAAILRLTAWSYPPRNFAVGAICDCALAAQALCVAMLSFAQSHIGAIDPFFLEHSLSLIRLGGVVSDSQDCHLYYRLVNLTCAGDMVDSQVMAFADHVTEINEPFDLAITIEDLLELWGPGELTSSQPRDPQNESSERWVSGIEIRGGFIYKPLVDSPKMHWKAGTAEKVLPQVMFLMVPQEQIIIGGIDLVNEACPVRPGRDNTISRTNINSVIEELGTWPEKWNVREKQGGLQGGKFINASFNATWIKSDSRTRKQKGLEQVDLDFLNRPWGLLVSLCTGVAQRVALREVVAEVILPMMDAWMEKTEEWQVLLSTGDGLLEELKKPTFRTWVSTLENTEQRVLNRIIGHILRKLCWTGINDSAKLVLSCPMFDDSDGCVHIPTKDCRGFAGILKDTEQSATFACLTNTFFVVEPWANECQHSCHPQWQNHLSALVSSVCQYQWRGANDWIKLLRTGLQDNVVYWMGTGNDKRRATAETTYTGGPSALKVSDNPAWRFLRRAYERYERVRQASHIQLRERSLMTENHTTKVMIVRE